MYANALRRSNNRAITHNIIIASKQLTFKAELFQVHGLLESHGGAPARVTEVRVCPAESPAANYAFDVTPARLVDYLVTERGVCTADERGVLALFPEHSSESGGGGAGKSRL